MTALEYRAAYGDALQIYCGWNCEWTRVKRNGIDENSRRIRLSHNIYGQSENWQAKRSSYKYPIIATIFLFILYRKVFGMWHLQYVNIIWILTLSSTIETRGLFYISFFKSFRLFRSQLQLYIFCIFLQRDNLISGKCFLKWSSGCQA